MTNRTPTLTRTDQGSKPNWALIALITPLLVALLAISAWGMNNALGGVTCTGTQTVSVQPGDTLRGSDGLVMRFITGAAEVNRDDVVYQLGDIPANAGIAGIGRDADQSTGLRAGADITLFEECS